MLLRHLADGHRRRRPTGCGLESRAQPIGEIVRAVTCIASSRFSCVQRLAPVARLAWPAPRPAVAVSRRARPIEARAARAGHVDRRSCAFGGCPDSAGPARRAVPPRRRTIRRPGSTAAGFVRYVFAAAADRAAAHRGRTVPESARRSRRRRARSRRPGVLRDDRAGPSHVGIAIDAATSFMPRHGRRRARRALRHALLASRRRGHPTRIALT